LECNADEIVFTSGGTEANNLAIKGTFLQNSLGQRTEAKGHLIISAIEHPSVANPAHFLKQFGYSVTIVGCDAAGTIDPKEIETALRSDTRLISVMHANNEVGTIQPIAEIAEICRERKVLVHTDASQSIGKIPTRVDELGVDMLSVAGHKFYAPKGIGALYVRPGVGLEPIIHGAGHERGLRAGTENTPYIVALGAAANLARRGIAEASPRMAAMRDRLARTIQSEIEGAVVNGEVANQRLPNTLSISFPRVSGQQLLSQIPELCASTGAACHSDGALESATLSAMGATPDLIRGTIRLSVGWQTNEDEIMRAASLLVDAWERLVDRRIEA
jgi:cysteine desulfurase